MLSRAPLTLPETVILSRPDRLGDAVITTATAGLIKLHAPGTRIVVLGRALTAPIWARCAHVDDFVTLEELDAAGDEAAIARLKAFGAGAIIHAFMVRRVAAWAKRAGILQRVASGRIARNWLTSNVFVNITRKRSRLHEAQLAIQLLAPFGVPIPPVDTLTATMGLTSPPPSPAIAAHLLPGRRHIVLHPMSFGGQRWGLANFAALMQRLAARHDQVILTGTAEEAATYRTVLPIDLPGVTDLGGRLSVDELWQLIAASDALVAGSTGPLHLAAVSGIRTIGIYPNFRAINPARWGPLGPDAHALVYDENCPTCLKGFCDCLQRVPVDRVLALLD